MRETKGRNGGTLKTLEKGDPPLPGAGRPRGSRTLAYKFQKFLEGETEWEVDGEMRKISREEALMFRLMKIAKEGVQTPTGENSAQCVAAIREIYDRAFGKPAQEFEHSGPDGGPIETNLSPVWVITKPPVDGTAEAEEAQ